MTIKIIRIILGLNVLLFNLTNAQKASGYFIRNNADTVKVKFEIPMESSTSKILFKKIQTKVTFYDSLNKKHVLEPPMAKEYSFDIGGYFIRMISLNDGITPYNNKFLKLVADGKLKLYRDYDIKESSCFPNIASTRSGKMPITNNTGNIMLPGPLMPKSYNDVTFFRKYYLQKEQEKLFDPSIDFYTVLIPYFSDCPDLATKIKENIYTEQDIEKIVKEYNDSCIK